MHRKDRTPAFGTALSSFGSSPAVSTLRASIAGANWQPITTLLIAFLMGATLGGLFS